MLLFMLSAGGIPATAQVADRLGEIAAGIAEGDGSSGRRQIILNALNRSGIEYEIEDFNFPRVSGQNIIVTLPAKDAQRTLLLGAHYDRVPQGQGAVDNAASCAVVLSLLSVLKAKPLRNYSVVAVFFDAEEGGLTGSQAYFAQPGNGRRLPDAAMNLDIFGYGDTLFATASNAEGPLIKALQQSANAASMEVRQVPSDKYPASDHRIMARAGIDTVGLALIDGTEIDRILRNDHSARILSIIHTAQDTPDKIRAADMDRGRSILDDALRRFDREATPTSGVVH
jgi:Zn-dependent M28 family amino/carboxypeptidase